MNIARQLFMVYGLLCCCSISWGQTKLSDRDTLSKKLTDSGNIKFDDTRNTEWNNAFELVEIRSGLDHVSQKAYFSKSRSVTPQPLVISLHTWSGDYSQEDDLATLCLQKDLNYIHPDFRGPNNKPEACCSEFVLADIDDAIRFAIKNGNVDTGRIYVMGVSGGGYATLGTFMKSNYTIRKFSAWASITDLESWYFESSILKNKYTKDVLACTGSEMELNTRDAKMRSPMHMKTPSGKLNHTQLFIYAGIYDGLRGSVPFTHSINFYNKLLKDLGVKDKINYVTDTEKLALLEFRRPLGDFGKIADRKICLQKKFKNIQLTIFEGDHEMLTGYALDKILKD